MLVRLPGAFDLARYYDARGTRLRSANDARTISAVGEPLSPSRVAYILQLSAYPARSGTGNRSSPSTLIRQATGEPQPLGFLVGVDHHQLDHSLGVLLGKHRSQGLLRRSVGRTPVEVKQLYPHGHAPQTLGSGRKYHMPYVSRIPYSPECLEGAFSEVGPQGDLEVSGLVLRQPFFDRQYDPFRQHEVRWGCNQPRDQVCHPLWWEYSGRRSFVRSTLLALLGREGSPVGGHRSRVEHDRSYAMLLPFVGESFGEARETELGSAVSRGVRPTLLARHRGDIDDNAASRLAHMREGLDGPSDRLRRLGLAGEVHGKG